MHAFIPLYPFAPRKHTRRRPPHRTLLTASASPDVVVIGAGIAGLSTALRLAQSGASVQILTSPSRKPAANASAGMLAPHAEQLSGHMHQLCHVSRRMFPNFVRNLRQLVDVDVQYVSRNDFLVPSLTPLLGPDVLTGDALRRVEPALGPNVKAARRCQADANVDSRRLMRALYEACVALGVKFQQHEVQSVLVAPDARSVEAVQTNAAHVVGGHYLIASGAWTSSLLPHIPVVPVKGQMLSLAAPEHDSQRLNHVLHGPNVYIVPKNGGNEFYVGATVENAGFDSKVTAGAICQLLNAATELVPKFAEYEIKETWSGFRPATPDLLPILGRSEYENVTIASGYYRNGILLAPATSSIAAAIILGEVDRLPSELRELADKFSYQRLLLDEDKPEMQQDIHKESVTSSNYPSANIKPPGQGISSAKVDTAVKVWQVNKDGTQKPIYPSGRYQRAHEQISRASEAPSHSDARSPVSESRLPDSQQSTFTDPGIYQGGEGFQSHVENPENISGENDAYEDVMRKRDIADEVMSRAMAANRAFGREKSSLETEGSVPLSISEEEVRAFDAALNQGVQDMRELEKHFDSNDPSVRATTAERERMEIEVADVGTSINGVVVPSLAKAGSTTGSESSDGYF